MANNPLIKAIQQQTLGVPLDMVFVIDIVSVRFDKFS